MYLDVINTSAVTVSIQCEAENGIAMASKRKRVVLTIGKNYKIIKTKLARIHKVGKFTIIDIENCIQNIDSMVRECNSTSSCLR